MSGKTKKVVFTAKMLDSDFWILDFFGYQPPRIPECPTSSIQHPGSRHISDDFRNSG